LFIENASKFPKNYECFIVLYLNSKKFRKVWIVNPLLCLHFQKYY